MNRWSDTSYLLCGTDTQRRAAEVLSKTKILDILQPFDATLVSPLCVGLDVSSSDLDIICSVPDVSHFLISVRCYYALIPEYAEKVKSDGVAVVRFSVDALPIEVYGSPLPVVEQHGYRHLCAVSRLIQLGGAPVFEFLRRRRDEGLKMEPAACEFLQLPGNPYEQLLTTEQMSDDELKTLIASSTARHT